MARKFYPAQVVGIDRVTADAFTIHFENPDTDSFAYLPGQYLTVKVPVGGEVLRRAYSLSSTPGLDANLSVTIKRIADGRVSSQLHQNLKVGDVLEIFPPLGNFVVKIDPLNTKHYVLIGAGSGITPLYSILRAVLAGEPHSRVTLVYGNRNEEGIIFAKELAQLTQQYGERLEVIHSLSQPGAGWPGAKGRLEGRHLYNLLLPVMQDMRLRKNFYLCGPNEMMQAALEVLDILNVPDSIVFREYYTTALPDENDLTAEEKEPVYELVTQKVKVIMDGAEFMVTVTPKQSILDSAIAAKMDPPYACQEGVCCTCRAKVLSGLVSMDEREGLSDDELNEGYILTCQAHPLSDDVVVEFG